MSSKSSNKELKFAVLATDVVVFRVENNELQVLLGEVVVPQFEGMLGLIGGILKPDETAEDAVERHLEEKAGIRNIYYEQVYTFSKVDRDPRGRVVSVAYMALTFGDPVEKDGTMNTRWVGVGEIEDLAYDHNTILNTTIERLRNKIGYTNIAQHLLSKRFTLTELQNTYEAVLGKSLDKRNFRRKVIDNGLVSPTGEKTTINTKRPAELYEFSSSQTEYVDIF